MKSINVRKIIADTFVDQYGHHLGNGVADLLLKRFRSEGLVVAQKDFVDSLYDECEALRAKRGDA